MKKNPNFYVFLGKRYLEIHETIELHALGNAVSTSVIASENLVRYARFYINSTKKNTIIFLFSFFFVFKLIFLILNLHYRNNYATFKEIKTKTITVDGNRGESKKAKLFITLQRGPDFFENMRKFSEIKEENERLASKHTATDDADTK